MSNMSTTEGICVTGVTSCNTFDCAEHGLCETVETFSHKGFNHAINTDYRLMVRGINIPLVKTIRTLDVQWETVRDAPVLTNGQYYFGEWLPVRCEVHGPDQHTCTFLEDCVIEKSVIHYLDLRYGVCLYKYTRESLVIDSRQRNNEVALFRTQAGPFHRVRIMAGDFIQAHRTEWRVVINGVESVIDSVDVEPSFIGGAYSSNHLDGASQWYPDYTRPPGIHKVLIFPYPGSMGIAQSDLECGTPFYDYSTPGGLEDEPAISDGGKDMFYPEWCRNMQEDPIWKEAAARRWNAKWWHVPEEKNRHWTPPAVYVDPIPRGTFARHPAVGEVYQFLTDMYGNHVTSNQEPRVTTSPSLDDGVSAALPEGQVLAGTTLYYPIGVI